MANIHRACMTDEPPYLCSQGPRAMGFDVAGRTTFPESLVHPRTANIRCIRGLSQCEQGLRCNEPGLAVLTRGSVRISPWHFCTVQGQLKRYSRMGSDKQSISRHRRVAWKHTGHVHGSSYGGRSVGETGERAYSVESPPVDVATSLGW